MLGGAFGRKIHRLSRENYTRRSKSCVAQKCSLILPFGLARPPLLEITCHGWQSALRDIENYVIMIDIYTRCAS